MEHGSSISARILSRSNTPLVLRALLAGLLLLALALYLPTYAWAFIGDDYVQFGYISELIETPSTFYQAFNPFWSTWYYRPLQNLWLLGNRLLFGLNPFPYYFLQGLWHLLASSLVYALARRLHLARGVALAATALFALNAHHQDVVGWISSVSTPMVTVFSFLAILSYTRNRVPGIFGTKDSIPSQSNLAGRRFPSLALSTLFALLALLSHETGILLPPLLLIIALLRPGERPAAEWLWLGLLLLLALAAGAVHLFRPNLTLAVQETPAAAYLDPAELARFLAVVFGRWTLLTKTAWGTALLNRLLAGPSIWLLPLGALSLLLWLAYKVGRNVAHDGSLRPRTESTGGHISCLLPPAWMVLHLGFVFGALWVQAPALLGGRHLYGAWAGVALALGMVAQVLLERWKKGRARGQRSQGRRGRRRAGVPALILSGLLAAWLIGHVYFAREAEASWLAHAEEVAAVEVQMKAMIPELTPATAVYANTFVLKPAFAPYAVAVWYGKTEVEGGSLNRLREAGAVGPETYLFDYERERLRDVLPGLHDYGATYLLWPAGTAPQIGGPAGAERLTTATAGQGWQTIAVTVTVPAGAGFYTAYYGPSSGRYRIRALAGGTDSLLAVGTAEETTAGWQEIALSLPRYWSKETTFLLESQGGGVWAQPRLVQE